MVVVVGLDVASGEALIQQLKRARAGGPIASPAPHIPRRAGPDANAGLVADELWARCKQALAGDAIRWMPGVEALVGALRAAGVPQALVSSGHRHYLDVTLDRLEPQPFSVVVAGDEVAHAKPHPEPYLRACAELGLEPGDCLAIEDSATGAASANAAGCAVLAVPSLGSMPDAPRRVLVDTLDGVDLVVLARLFQRASVG